MLLDRDVGIAGQVGQQAAQLLLEHRLLLARDVEVVLRRVVFGARGEVALHQLGLAPELPLGIGDVLARELQLLLLLPVAGLERVDLVVRLPQPRLGLASLIANGCRSSRNSSWPGSTCWFSRTRTSTIGAGHLGADRRPCRPGGRRRRSRRSGRR